MSVAVVTDSTAYLPAHLVQQFDVEVVPLYVVLAGRSGREGSDVTPGEVARALGTRSIWAERDAEGHMALRRGFNIRQGEPVFVVEDVVTTVPAPAMLI